MKRSAKLLTILLIGGTLFASDTTGPVMSSPVLGYVYDDTAKTIRAITGVPGAASLGDAVALPSALTSAVVHSTSRQAAVVTKEGKLAVASWAGEARVTVLDSSLTSVAHAAFSGSGGKLAVSDGATIEVWNAGGASLISRYSAGAAVTALAVNNDGTVLTATEERQLLRFSDHGAESLANGSTWSVVAFSNDGADAVAVDATHNELVRIAADGSRTLLAAVPESVNGLVVASNGVSFAIALPAGLMLISESGSAAEVACDCQPKGLDVLQGVLTAHVRGTTLLLDASSGEAQLMHLPNLIAVNAGGAN